MLLFRPQFVELTDGDAVGARNAFRAQRRISEVLLHVGFDAGDQGLVGGVVSCQVTLADGRDGGPGKLQGC
jgi:hypothetical protein